MGKQALKVLFIGAHMDDVELSCGGTLIKYIERGFDVECISFSRSYSCGNIGVEFVKSMESLGVKKYKVMDFKTRNFDSSRQDILDELIKAGEGRDLIFTHSAKDTHQDHRVIGEESLRAFKKQEVITYQSPWNGAGEPNSFSILDKKHLDRKIQAIACYQSQAGRRYMNEEFIRSAAIVSGVRCGWPLAEEFQVVRVINY